MQAKCAACKSRMRHPKRKLTESTFLFSFDCLVKETAELRSSQSPVFPATHYASLLAGLIHKSNNILTVLSGHSGLLLLEANLSEKILEPVRRMSRAAEMLSRYIDEAGALSKATVLVLEPIAFLDFLKMLKPPSGLEIQRADADDVTLLGDRRKLRETFEEVLRNAIEADATSVIVSATKEQLTVCLSFRDDGHGIKAEVMEKVFDPFFTTHTQQGRFGLGLFRAKGELARMNGEISAVSDGKTYTEILIRIPAA